MSQSNQQQSIDEFNRIYVGELMRYDAFKFKPVDRDYLKKVRECLLDATVYLERMSDNHLSYLSTMSSRAHHTLLDIKTKSDELSRAASALVGDFVDDADIAKIS